MWNRLCTGYRLNLTLVLWLYTYDESRVAWFFPRGKWVINFLGAAVGSDAWCMRYIAWKYNFNQMGLKVTQFFMANF